MQWKPVYKKKNTFMTKKKKTIEIKVKFEHN